MKRERKNRLTAAELKAAGMSRDLVVRKIRPEKPHRPGPAKPGQEPRDRGNRTAVSAANGF